MNRTAVKGILFGLALLAALFAGSMLRSNAQTPGESEASTAQRTVTVTGFGESGAPADRVVVRIFTGGEAIYGPSGPTYQVPNSEELAIVVETLVDLGIDASTIFTNPFASTSFAPSGQSAEIRFTLDEPEAFIPFLTRLQEQLKQRRGPNIAQVASVFLPEDCGAVEQEAMAHALAMARQRAERMAEQAHSRLGDLMAVKETSSTLIGPVGPLGGCAALEASIDAAPVYPYLAGSNTPQVVKIRISVEATYAVRPE